MSTMSMKTMQRMNDARQDISYYNHYFRRVFPPVVKLLKHSCQLLGKRRYLASRQRSTPCCAQHNEASEDNLNLKGGGKQGPQLPSSNQGASSSERRAPARLPSSSHFLHITNDSLPRSDSIYTESSVAPSLESDRSALGGAASGPGPGTSEAVARARRHANLAASLVQFVAKLPPASSGSAAEALRSKLGSRLAVGPLGVWIAQVTQALSDATSSGSGGSTAAELGDPRDAPASAVPGSGGGAESGPDTGMYPTSSTETSSPVDSSNASGSPSGRGGANGGVGARASGVSGVGFSQPQAAEVDEMMVEAMLAAQPQLLAQDSTVLAARVRGLAALLAVHPSEALAIAASRPGLLLLDLVTLERRLDGLAAAMGLPDRAAAVAMARRQPAWLYADLPAVGPGATA